MNEMQATEWIATCSLRLQQQWRTVDPSCLDEVAAELWADARWRQMPPSEAAVQWLRQGVLAEQSDSGPLTAFQCLKLTAK